MTYVILVGSFTDFRIIGPFDDYYFVNQYAATRLSTYERHEIIECKDPHVDKNSLHCTECKKSAGKVHTDICKKRIEAFPFVLGSDCLG